MLTKTYNEVTDTYHYNYKDIIYIDPVFDSEKFSIQINDHVLKRCNILNILVDTPEQGFIEALKNLPKN